MTPRLASSKKWTAFPADFVDQIREALLETFAEQLKDAELLIEGRIYSTEILLRVGFLRKNQLVQNNFEVSIEYKQDTAVDRIHDAIDAAASMMADFLEAEEDVELPREWQEFDFENQKIHFQYSTSNTRLEAEADRLLGEEEQQLVKDADEASEELSEDEPTPPKDKNKLH